METKKSKYDTNPLDPDVERKAEEVWGDLGGTGGTPTQQVGGATREGSDSANENARRQPGNQVYQAPYSATSRSRHVAGVGIPEKWALLLAYFPYIGIVASIIEL